MLEDHIEAPPDYCARLLDAFASDESVLAVVGTVTNGAPRAIDRASFLLAWGPFLAPLTELPGPLLTAGGDLVSAARIPKILLDQTRAGLRRSGSREPFTCMSLVTAFAACNALGQMVGVVRAPGGSPRHLE